MKNSKGFEENLFYNRVGEKPTGIIRVNSGIYVDVFNPTPEMFTIEDIAHGLSMIPRFGGHTYNFISVAEHCFNCLALAETINAKDQLDILMHDASEAYLLDIPSPIKKLLKGYSEIEDNLMKVLSLKFGFEYPLTDIVKRADKEALQFEWNEFVLKQGSSNLQNPKQAFLNKFKILSV